MSLNPLVSETIVATIFLIKETRKLGEFHYWRRKVANCMLKPRSVEAFVEFMKQP